MRKFNQKETAKFRKLMTLLLPALAINQRYPMSMRALWKAAAYSGSYSGCGCCSPLAAVPFVDQHSQQVYSLMSSSTLENTRWCLKTFFTAQMASHCLCLSRRPESSTWAQLFHKQALTPPSCTSSSQVLKRIRNGHQALSLTLFRSSPKLNCNTVCVPDKPQCGLLHA